MSHDGWNTRHKLTGFQTRYRKMHVHLGTDAYGRVKNVCGTAIVTKFFMLNYFPIYPLRSFYLTSLGPIRHRDNFPLFAETEIQGIELARIDRVSVVMAYLRGIFAFFTIMGSIGGMFSVVIYLNNANDVDETGAMIFHLLVILLQIGVVGGTLTYLIPLTSSREREIRRYCGELLGLAIDPARVSAEVALLLREFAERSPIEATDDRHRRLLMLVFIRSKIAEEPENRQHELATDEVLMQLHA